MHIACTLGDCLTSRSEGCSGSSGSVYFMYSVHVYIYMYHSNTTMGLIQMLTTIVFWLVL